MESPSSEQLSYLGPYARFGSRVRETLRPGLASPPGPGAISPVAFVLRRVLGLVPPVVMALVGASLLAEQGGGLAWWPLSLLLAYAAALLGVWVLLIEILR